jgi:phosphatidylserine/phosphatidylglycerophosphate/cardiolipin synthase-like enzyme
MHTKSILIDDRLSLIGSFNWDMRSVYLDTELMLLVDCPALNAALRERTEEMMRQSRLAGRHGNSGRELHRAGTLAAQGRLADRHTQPHPSVPVRAVSRRAAPDAARTACQNFACVHGLFKQIAKKHAII